ncbi:MAG: DJ-1/PfpI family protein [Clostridia bacterium]|nr:DJ-1/PfpI family protein [Clostridia bacterium]
MVNVYLAEGFEEVEAITVIDMLRRAQIEVTTVSIGEKTVTGAHNIKVEADVLLGNEPVCEMIFLPGGMPGVTNLYACEPLREKLIAHNGENKYVAAICAAPMILGKLGILKDRKAVCYPGFEEYFEGGTPLYDNVCVDGNVITSRGAGTALEFSYKIISILKDEATASEIKKGIIDNR